MSNPLVIEPPEVESANIMIVDDESINVEILHELLKSEGFQNISSFTSPLEASERYQQEDFDLVLLDIFMPKMDGFEVMESFQRCNKTVPAAVLILTANNDRDIRIRALEGGARDFIPKLVLHTGNQTGVGIARDANCVYDWLLNQRYQENNDHHQANLQPVQGDHPALQLEKFRRWAKRNYGN